MGNVTAVVNIKEAMELFERITIQKQKVIFNSALRRIMKPLVAQSAANFRGDFDVATGRTIKSLGSMLYRKKIGIATGMRLKYLKQPDGTTKGIYEGYYGRFLNTGTKDRYTKKGQYRGKIKASLWFDDPAERLIAKGGSQFADAVIYAINKAASRKGGIVYRQPGE